jgi:hypothetical protein
MEISSSTFPFLNQEEFSHFYSWVQEMEGDTIDDNNLRKRVKREDNNGGVKEERMKKEPLKDIVSSLILLDEEEKQGHKKWVMDSEQDRTLIDSNYNQQSKSMVDYYQTHIQNHYSDINQIDQSRAAKRRRSSSSVAAAAAAAIADNSVEFGSGSTELGQTELTQPQTHQRRLWVKDRSKDWWEKCNHPDFPDEEFKKAFRMSKATLDLICEELDSVVTKKNTMLRDAIPVRQRVAVCIWRLATGEPLRLVSKRFGLGISTCHKLVLEVCSAIKTVLMKKYVQWPDEENMNGIKQGFERISGIPNVGGSMYTTHVPIIAPKISVAAYFNKRHTERNQKTSYSITVQGVVNPRGVFTDVCIGWPGSMLDDQVLEKSALHERANRGLLKDIWIVGNSSYPLMDWVMVPYTHQNLTWTQHEFNTKIGDVQRVAKDAFARLKGRWACLQKRTEVKLQDLPVVLGACCVLHNICEMRNEGLDPELEFGIFDDEVVLENNLVRSINSEQARDHIAHNLLHHGPAGTGYSYR